MVARKQELLFIDDTYVKGVISFHVRKIQA